MFIIRHITDRADDLEAVATFFGDFLHGRRASEDTAIADQEMDSLHRTLHEEMRSAEPATEFVDALRLRLIAAADQRAPADDIVIPWRQPAILIGAASLVSAAAVIAYVARSRMPHRPAA